MQDEVGNVTREKATLRRKQKEMLGGKKLAATEMGNAFNGHNMADEKN